VSTTLDLTVTASAANVGKLRKAIVAFAERHDAEDDVCRDVALAVSEAVTNAIVHGYRDRATDASHTIRMTAAIERRTRLRVAVSDQGVGMSPRPDSPGMGVGLPLIAQLADDLQVLTDGGTTIVMHFALRRDRGPRSAVA
jgi:serine/threonine-protein kinase RsbW